MKLDFRELYALLKEDSVLTYKLQYQLFHCPLDTDAKVWFDRGAAMLLEDSLHLYGDEAVLDKFLLELPQDREYNFFGTPLKLLPLLQDHFKNIELEEDCSAYTITPDDFAKNGLKDLEELGSLGPEDAEFVNDHWTYKHEGSLGFFKRILAVHPSSAIRIDGKLVGWAVCYDSIDDMVNLGSLRVLEEYRNQGLGRKLALDLVNKVLQANKTPMVHILDNNIASKTLSMGIGFKPHSEKIFWGTGIKK